MIGLGEDARWRRLAELIETELAERHAGIVSGNLDGIERYRFETGFVQGLTWALNQAHDLMREQPRAEDEAAVDTFLEAS